MNEVASNAEDLTKTRHRSESTADPAANESGWELVNPKADQLKRIKINGSDLTYTERGTGDPVILVHGALGDYRTWSSQLDSLSHQYRVISYSRRYHQPNVQTSELLDYTLRIHVDDLIALIDELQVGPAHLVGHSYGAAVAALVALERPEIVSTLTLGEPSLFSILSSLPDIASFRLHRIALNVVQKLTEIGEQRLAVREYVNIVLDKDVFEKLPIETLLVINQNANTLGPMLRTYFEPTALNRDRALNIKKATLVITGEASPNVYKAITREVNSSFANSELLILPGASHGLQMENPVGFNNAVLEFLSRHRSGG
jgi:non-heme chloroperoxidase